MSDLQGFIDRWYNGYFDQLAQTFADHDAAIPTKLSREVAALQPTRVLDIPFQPSLANPCLVFYTVELVVTAGLLSAQMAQVELLSDAAVDPTVNHGTAKLVSEQMLGLVGVGITTTTRQQLTAFIEPSDYVELASSGTGSMALVSSLEVEFSG